MATASLKKIIDAQYRLPCSHENTRYFWQKPYLKLTLMEQIYILHGDKTTLKRYSTRNYYFEEFIYYLITLAAYFLCNSNIAILIGHKISNIAQNCQPIIRLFFVTL